MKEIVKEFNGDGSKVSCTFPCTKPGCSNKVNVIFAKPSDGHSDVTASCACGVDYEITLLLDNGDVSGTVTIRDVNGSLKKEEVTATVV